MSHAEHTPSAASAVPAPAHPSRGAGGTNDTSTARPATRKGHIGLIVAGSLVTGVVAALLLAAAPFIGVQENDITGAVLWGFALGWAMLAVLSVRFTDQPQRWAVVPAVFMGVSGLLLVASGSGINDVLRWVWPPALLALAIWMAMQAHRQLPSRTRRWLLYRSLRGPPGQPLETWPVPAPKGSPR